MFGAAPDLRNGAVKIPFQDSPSLLTESGPFALPPALIYRPIPAVQVASPSPSSPSFPDSQPNLSLSLTTANELPEKESQARTSSSLPSVQGLRLSDRHDTLVIRNLTAVMEARTVEASSVKKRKQVDISQLIKAKLVQLSKKPRRRVVTVSNEESSVREANEESDNAVCRNPCCSGSDHVDDGTSCCLSNSSSELVEDGGDEHKVVDLKADADDDEVESQTYNPLRQSRRQMAPSSNIQPQPTPAEPRRGTKAEKMPTELELEEFFTAAEKDIQSKFSKKYNYDVRKDEPLEGRYEWTRLKP